MRAEDNVKIVQEMYSAFLRRDVPGILVLLEDDIIWIVPGCSNCANTSRKGTASLRWSVTKDGTKRQVENLPLIRDGLDRREWKGSGVPGVHRH